MAAVYGVAQAAFVAARSWAPDSTTLWSGIVLAVVLAVGVAWAGSEVVLGRRPEEWTWFRAALAAAPAAGLLSWILLALFVDASGVADLGAALVGRATFTALLVLASATVGSRLGWLALRRRGVGDDDPELDRDETDPDAARAARAAARRARGPRDVDDAPVLDDRTTSKVARLRGRDEPEVGPEADDDRTRRLPQPVPAPPAPTPSAPTPSAPTRPARTQDEPAAPVVAVLPESSYVAPAEETAAGVEDEEPDHRPRRRRGLRRPG